MCNLSLGTILHHKFFFASIVASKREKDETKFQWDQKEDFAGAFVRKKT